MEQKAVNAIVIGSDHAGWEMKEMVKNYLAGKGMEVTDLSEPVYDKTDDYPKYAFKVARAVAAGTFSSGIAVCGSGIGASMAANRVRGVRAGCAGRTARRRRTARPRGVRGRPRAPPGTRRRRRRASSAPRGLRAVP